MTSLQKNASKYHLPMTSTPEEIETNLDFRGRTLNFGQYYIVTGYTWGGAMNKPSFFGAVYKADKDRFNCDDEVNLVATSDELFWDTGRAAFWAMSNCEG